VLDFIAKFCSNSVILERLLKLSDTMLRLSDGARHHPVMLKVSIPRHSRGL